MTSLHEIAEGRGILLRGENTVDARDVCAEMRTVAARFPQLASWYFAIADLSAVQTVNVLTTDFDLLVELHRKLAKVVRPGLAVAVFAKSELVFGISRMWQAAVESTGWDIQVFHERPAAEAWLRHCMISRFGLELPALAPAAQSAPGT